MSAVTDHTVLADHMAGGATLAAVLAVYSRTRQPLIIPATAITAAAAELGTAPARAGAAFARLAWLLRPALGAVVKVAHHGPREAYSVARTVAPPNPLDAPPTADPAAAVFPGDPGPYLLHGPVAWLALRLGMPVLTRTPAAYAPYGVATLDATDHAAQAADTRAAP